MTTGKQKEAFSLVELILIAVFVGIFALIAVPRLNYALVTRAKADTTARKIVTDLRRTRRLAISDAASNNKGYMFLVLDFDWYSGYSIINRDTWEVVDSHTFDSGISVTGDNLFRFGPLGSLRDAGHSQLSVAAEGKSFTITINPATGAIK